MALLEDAWRAMLLDATAEPLTEWHHVYNLNPSLVFDNSMFQVELAVVSRSERFGDVVTARDPFNEMSLLVQRRDAYYIFKNCIFQRFQAMSLGTTEQVQYSETTFYCRWYEKHDGNGREQIIRPIRSQQSRPQANPDTGIRNRLEHLGRNPDCGRDSDGPVDWLNNGF
jgi:hypothetical protein